MTTVTAITPVRNGEGLIGRTVTSIASQSAVQSGRVELQYLLCDGASTDATVAAAAAAAEAAAVKLDVSSEADGGMYDALSKGFARADGDIVFYLNAGDMLFPGALDTVIDIMATQPPSVSWLTGYSAVVNEAGVVVATHLPFRYRRRLLRTRIYGHGLPTVQQESCFWRRELLNEVDLEELATYRLAGDHYLWSRFARVAEPSIARALLGGFSQHSEHLSHDVAGYRAEVARHARPLSATDRAIALVDAVLWRSPDRVKKIGNRDHLLMFAQATGRWT